MLKSLTFAAALALAAPASAQSGLVEIDDTVQVPMFGMSADAVENMDVLGPGGSKIGEVDEEQRCGHFLLQCDPEWPPPSG